jgi:hypothetical protein
MLGDSSKVLKYLETRSLDNCHSLFGHSIGAGACILCVRQLEQLSLGAERNV